MSVYESLPGDICEGMFIERVNRFVGKVKINGKEEFAHVPSSGRMRELLCYGARVYLAPAKDKKRKTKYTLLLAGNGENFVSLDSVLPNRLLEKAIAGKQLIEFKDYDRCRREYSYSNSRFDFLLTGDQGNCLIEVKSVTLVKNKVAMFPDAPSLRGTRHLEELCESIEKGFRAAVVFIVQRSDAMYFSPNGECDPEFSRVLQKAYQNGVNIYAFTCKVTPENVKLNGRIPVEFFKTG